jgi:hypothetical protein
MQNPFAHWSFEDRVARTLLGVSLAALGLAVAVFLSAGGDLSPSARGVVLSALLIGGVLKLASSLVRPIGQWLNQPC